MRILQLTNKIPYPPSDGGTIAMWQAAAGFAELGNELSILCMQTAKHRATTIDSSQFPENLTLEMVDVPARITPWGMLGNLLFSSLPYTASRFIHPAFEKKLIQLLSEKEYDLVQLEGLYLLPYTSVIRKHSKALIALRAHNIEHEIWERLAEQSTLLKGWYLSNLSNRILEFKLQYLDSFDLLIPITQRDADYYQRLGSKQAIFVAPVGISEQLNASGSAPQSKPAETKPTPAQQSSKLPDLFHLGAMDWPPNIEGLEWFLKEIWPMARHQHPGLKLHLAGRNAPASIVKRWSNLPGVIFHGEVPSSKAFIVSYPIMIVPLLSGSGMRVKMMEGMMHERAIISTPVGMEGIAVTPDKNCIIASDKTAWINAINQLIMNPLKIEHLGKAASRLVQEKYAARSIVEKWCAFYENALTKAPQ